MASLFAVKKSVLLIDDDPGVIRATRRLIAHLYVVETANSIERALELVRGGARFDAILCDFNLGDSNAGELVSFLATVDPPQAARIVVYSGVSPVERERLGGMGMAVLAKPSRREDLVHAIEKASTSR
jgi:CheY-like chemotaxis protein